MISEKKQATINYLEKSGKEVGHIMSKKEAKVLRKLKSKLKISEKEIRKIPKYRKMLSEAAKVDEINYFKRDAKSYENLKRAACSQTGLVLHHPKTIEVLQNMEPFWYRHNQAIKEMIQQDASIMRKNMSKKVILKKKLSKKK